MKRSRVCVTTACVLLLSFAARSATVGWPAADLAEEDPLAYLLSITISPYGGGAGVWMEIQQDGSNPQLQATSMTAGLGHVWYSVAYGTPVDVNTTASATYFASLNPPQAEGLDVYVDQLFYLGFQFEYDVFAETYAYGWAALVWDGTTLSLVDSAAETTGVGIYAGTYNPVPEPATAGLLLAGLGTMAVRWRRRRGRARRP